MNLFKNKVKKEIDETVGIIEKAVDVLHKSQRLEMYMTDRLLNANSFIQLQAMFIEKMKLKDEFHNFLNEYGYKYKNKTDSDDKSDIITT